MQFLLVLEYEIYHLFPKYHSMRQTKTITCNALQPRCPEIQILANRLWLAGTIIISFEFFVNFLKIYVGGALFIAMLLLWLHATVLLIPKPLNGNSILWKGKNKMLCTTSLHPLRNQSVDQECLKNPTYCVLQQKTSAVNY